MQVVVRVHLATQCCAAGEEVSNFYSVWGSMHLAPCSSRRVTGSAMAHHRAGRSLELQHPAADTLPRSGGFSG